MKRPYSSSDKQDVTEVPTPQARPATAPVSGLRRHPGPLHQEHLRLAGHNVEVTEDELGVVELHLE